jgi:hypothetical protein
MKKPLLSKYLNERALAIGTLLTVMIPLTAMSEELTGRAIIDRYMETLDADSELAYIRMKTYIPDGLHSIVKEHRFLALMRKNGKGKRSYMMRMIRPVSVEGVTLLAIEGGGGTEQFSYLPDIGYVTRISPDSRSGAFLGSDFTYEDLLREVPGNFRYERQPDQVVHGVECYALRAYPESEAPPSYYLYRDLYIEKEAFTVSKIDFYTSGDKPVKTFDAYEYNSPEVSGETLRPRHAVLADLEKNTMTVMNVVEGRLNTDLDPKLFTPDAIVELTPVDLRNLIFTQGFTVTD